MRHLFRVRLLPLLVITTMLLAALVPQPVAAAGNLVLQGTVYYDDGNTVSPLAGETVRLFVSVFNWQGLGYQSWVETAHTTTSGVGTYSITFATPAPAQYARLVVIDDLCRNKSATPSGDAGFNGSAPDKGAIAFSPGLVPTSGTKTFTGNDFVINPPCRIKSPYGPAFTGTVFKGYPDGPSTPQGSMRVGLYFFLPQLDTWLFDSDFWSAADGTFFLKPKYAARDYRLRLEWRDGLAYTGARVPWPGVVASWATIEYRTYPDLLEYGNNDFYVTFDEGPTPGCVFGVNLGGGVYTDTQGMRWDADQYYRPGMTYYGALSGMVYTTTMPISNTLDDPLYQSELFNLRGYRFYVPDDVYTVTLKFAEIYAYAHPHARDFDVQIGMVTVDTHLDPYTMAGAKYTAVDRTYVGEATGHTLSIDFVTHDGVPAVKAIKIEQQNCTP